MSNCVDELNPKYEFILDYNNDQKIHRIFFNPNNCGYNFIQKDEILDIKNNITKSVVWIVPLNFTDNENVNENEDVIFTEKLFQLSKYKCLGNFTYLNEKHIHMLKTLKNLYNNEQYEGFFNTSSILPVQYILHIHIFNRKDIKWNNPTTFFSQGTRIDKFLSIDNVINFINFNPNYFNNYESESLSYF